MTIEVRGTSGATYAFTIQADPQYLPQWRADGLQVNELCNVVPQQVAALGLTRPWCAAQDLWQWLRLW